MAKFRLKVQESDGVKRYTPQAHFFVWFDIVSANGDVSLLFGSDKTVDNKEEALKLIEQFKQKKSAKSVKLSYEKLG